MSKAVFVFRPDSIYNDLPEVQYHFPHTYLNKAREAIGDWILYYEPGKGGRRSYFATAFLQSIEPDPSSKNHYYAFLEGYIEFPSPVPFRVGNHFYESRLRGSRGGVNSGLAQRAIRHLPENEYLTILKLGMAKSLAPVLPDTKSWTSEIAEPEANYGRPVIQQIINRPVRDEAFKYLIRDAYDSTCAMTGIKLINGGGRCEIEAAHIRPVKEHGPDSPRNGIALSRTCHWMFDRGIFSLEDDGKLLMAKRLVPEPVKHILRPDGYVKLPEKDMLKPHKQFLRYHRNHVFKG